MIQVRKASERGHANHGWLDSWHTFSFADYYDPQHMHFSVLRVINEDRVQPATGFGTHPHQSMEIITYVLEGALQHKDSMGNGSIIRPGEVQLMSAGSGVTHSEFNASKDELVHLLQIWLLPASRGGEPGYQQKGFDATPGKLQLIVSPEGSEGSLRIKQDARIYRAHVGAGQALDYAAKDDRRTWIQVARGALHVNGTALTTGDGAAIASEPNLRLAATDDAEFLLFDLP